jgi:hypothetical protein
MHIFRLFAILCSISFLSSCGIVRLAQMPDAHRVLDLQPPKSEEIEARRYYYGPEQTSRSNRFVEQTLPATIAFYREALLREGWKEAPQTEGNFPHISAVLNFHRGFESAWIEITDVGSPRFTRMQVMQNFDIHQPGDLLSKMLQAAWDNLFQWLPVDNPLRQTKYIF